MSRVVDNSGRGNCMYYAYSISLMYYLLKKRDKTTAEKIFSRLALTEDQIIKLNELLDNKELFQFTQSHKTEIIEPILGKATRNAAAAEVEAQFIKNPKSTELFSSTHYGSLYYFRRELENKESPLAPLLSDCTFDNEILTQAEIYKAFEQPSLRRHIQDQYSTILSQYDTGWEKEIDKIYEEKKGTITKEKLREDAFYQKQFLTDLVQESTVDFFKSNQLSNLTKYKEHLSKDCIWGSEDTLMVLHRFVQGEEEQRDANGQVQRSYDTEIVLEIYKDGIPKSGSKIKSTDMILNNISNCHWVSIIDAPKKEPHEDKSNEQYIAGYNGKVSDNNDSVIISTLFDDYIMSTFRMELLEYIGFNASLDKLQIKVITLSVNHKNATEEAAHIFYHLCELREQFITKESAMSPEEFAAQTQKIIDEAPITYLKKHRGVGQILNELINAAISLANIVIAISHLFYSKIELIDYNRLPTNSVKQVNGLKESVSALLAIRKREEHKNSGETSDENESLDIIHSKPE